MNVEWKRKQPMTKEQETKRLQGRLNIYMELESEYQQKKTEYEQLVKLDWNPSDLLQMKNELDEMKKTLSLILSSKDY